MSSVIIVHGSGFWDVVCTVCVMCFSCAEDCDCDWSRERIIYSTDRLVLYGRACAFLTSHISPRQLNRCQERWSWLNQFLPVLIHAAMHNRHMFRATVMSFIAEGPSNSCGEYLLTGSRLAASSVRDTDRDTIVQNRTRSQSMLVYRDSRNFG